MATPPRAPALPFWKVLALGICAMAIGPNLALSAAYQLHYTGLHSWLAFLGAALLSMSVAAAIIRCAQRFDGTASILSYAKLSLPRGVTAVVAATLLLGYLLGPADGVIAEAIYLSSLAIPLSRNAASPWFQCVTVVLAALFIGACAYRGTDISARIATGLGIACVPVAIWITVASGASFGFDIRPELSFADLSWVSMCQGVFVAMAFFIGFDGVATLASETADPRHNVPKLLIWVLVIAGVTLSAGTLLQAPVLLAHASALEAGESPTRIMAVAGKIPSLAVASDVVLAMAGMASLIGWLNISAVIIATASKDGFLPAALSHLHPRYGSPYRAVGLLTGLSVVIPVAMIFLTRSAAITSTVYLTNVMVLLWIIPYGAICVAATRRLHPGERPGGLIVLPPLGFLAILCVAGAALLSPIDGDSATVNAVGAGVIAVVSVFFVMRDSK